MILTSCPRSTYKLVADELTDLVVTFCATQILRECLASLGLVRGVPEGEFHALVSTLRDRAEKAARGFVSVEVGEASAG